MALPPKHEPKEADGSDTLKGTNFLQSFCLGWERHFKYRVEMDA